MASDYLFFEGCSLRPSRRPPAKRPPLRRRAVFPDDHSLEFAERVFTKAGLRIRAYRQATLQRRLPACLRYLGVNDLQSAMKKLESRPDLVPGMINIFLLGVSEFFRDPSVFGHIREMIIPDWVRKKHRLRIWSAACADGQELYSMGMLLADSGFLPRTELLGTDFRPDAIQTAQEGYFSYERLDALGDQRKLRHLSHGAARPQIRQSLRDAVQWKQANLLEAMEPGPWDMILWRNMAIYLEPKANDRVWEGLVREMAEGGYLIVGKADYPPSDLGLERISKCIYRKTSND